ncbi:MAG TPA: hypothetical protein V6D37_10180 [Candidatus Sericytochromatia bacterium]|jgi:transposase-like protein
MAKKQNETCNPSVTHYGRDYHKPICPKCGSTNVATGAGRKPNKMSLKCSECKAFIGYKNLEKLKKLRRQKQLTPCLKLLKNCGVTSDTAIFVLGQVGDES